MFGLNKSSSWMLLLCYVLIINIGIILTHPAIAADKSDAILSDSDLMEDESRSFENALINYLFAKQFLNRQRHQGDLRELQRKRSYWKQCAFNAVSCFG